MQKKLKSRRRKQTHELLFRAITVSISLLVTLSVIEVALRLAWPQIFPPHPPGMYSPDDDVGYVLTPDSEWEFRRAEFWVSVQTNKTGLRGKDLRPLKKNSVRILCLGDSFTWGWGVNDNEAYPAELEKLLQSRYPLFDVQVLNAGVPGYGTNKELEFLKKWGAHLKPNIVIVQFFSGNDFIDNRFSETHANEFRDGMLYKVFRPATQQKPVWLRIIDWLQQRSHLAYLVSNRVGYLAMRIGLLDELERSSSVYFTEEDGRRTTDYLVGIGKIADQLEARTLFVHVPEKAQVMSRPKGSLRSAALVHEAAIMAEASSVDLTLEFVKKKNLQKLYFVADPHWTSKGHKLAAQILSKQISDLYLIHMTK
jgi:lysophospholipase L1-like esterase